MKPEERTLRTRLHSAIGDLKTAKDYLDDDVSDPVARSRIGETALSVAEALNEMAEAINKGEDLEDY
jgi:hypothetical protein